MLLKGENKMDNKKMLKKLQKDLISFEPQGISIDQINEYHRDSIEKQIEEKFNEDKYIAFKEINN